MSKMRAVWSSRGARPSWVGMIGQVIAPIAAMSKTVLPDRRMNLSAAVVAACALSLGAATSARDLQPAPTVQYSIVPPPTSAAALRDSFTSQQLASLELLNRADTARLARLPALVVPNTWHDDPLVYSPFPRRYDAWRPDAPQLLIVDQGAQAFAAYAYGNLVRWGAVNSGRQSMQTPAGLFHLTWRSRGRHSTVDPDWFMPWYFNFHNTRGLSFHQYALPGRPASHACIRLLERDARWLFDWGQEWRLDDRGWTVLEQGTPVLILNCYNFDQSPPWRSPAWLERSIALPASPDTSSRSCPVD